MKKRSLTGIQPSGNIHLGNYLGMIKPALEAQGDNECFYFMADLHSLTSKKDPGLLRRSTYDAVATWLALGFDHKKHVLYRQSDIPQVTEFTWYLSCCTGMGLLEKGHAYKDAVAAGRDANHGLFAYPVLMAADILMYDVDFVPVGKDQKQHVEMARDMAGSFNAAYSVEALKLPLPVIREEVMTIPGLDGRKMSKSYGNEIALFLPENELRKKVLSLKTDSTPLEDPKSMKDTVLGDLFKLFATAGATADLEQRLNRGGLGWGHAKQELFEVVNAEITEPRKRYNDLRSDEAGLEDVLLDGARRAAATGLEVLNRVREIIGLRPMPIRL
jgi:tryptophanyl-tRNA synthetase